MPKLSIFYKYCLNSYHKFRLNQVSQQFLLTIMLFILKYHFFLYKNPRILISRLVSLFCYNLFLTWLPAQLISRTVGSRCQVWHSKSRQSFWRGSILEAELFPEAESLPSVLSSEDARPTAAPFSANPAKAALLSAVSLLDGLMLLGNKKLL